MNSSVSLSSSPPRLLPPSIVVRHLPSPSTSNLLKTRTTTTTPISAKYRATKLRVSSSSSEKSTAVVSAPGNGAAEVGLQSAAEAVRSFYNGINGGDLSSVEGLIAENCVYEDLIFPSPFVGRKAIMDFFKKFIDVIDRNLQFVIDDISTDDPVAIGVTWHLEWQGKTFPFSKGCSFYRLEIQNGRRQIVYGRDSVEPAIKPGETALVAIRGVTWLLRQFPLLVDRL